MIDFQLAAGFLGVPYNDVYENGLSKTQRERLYDDYINIMRQRFSGNVVRAPSRTLLRADEAALPPAAAYGDPNQQVNVTN